MKDISEMSLEEVQKQLEAEGFSVNSWASKTEQTVTLPFADEQIKLLTNLKALVEEQTQKSFEEIAHLQAKKQRLLFGGGG